MISCCLPVVALTFLRLPAGTLALAVTAEDTVGNIGTSFTLEAGSVLPRVVVHVGVAFVNGVTSHSGNPVNVSVQLSPAAVGSCSGLSVIGGFVVPGTLGSLQLFSCTSRHCPMALCPTFFCCLVDAR